MITLTKLDHSIFALNSDLIETIEEMPDTIIRLSDKNYFHVLESMDEVVEKVIAFRRMASGYGPYIPCYERERMAVSGETET